MKILCVYIDKLREELPLGLLYIATALRKKGHVVDFCSIADSRKGYLGYLTRSKNLLMNSFLGKCLSFKPDVICFTVHSNEYSVIIELSKLAKSHLSTKIVVGGPHATFMADQLDYNVIDFACRGEGDQAIVELVDCIEYGVLPEKILNISGVYNGKYCSNPVRDLIDDLDSLPFPDRSLIDPDHLRNFGTNVVSGRGCPFSCTYCIAKHISNFYHDKGKYVRWRSHENIIEELEEIKKRYQIPKVLFSDQTFTLNKKRLLEFLEIYKSKIQLPFVCQTRADRVDKEIYTAMKEAGCDFIYMGIETGNEYLRTEVLKRRQTKEQIVEAFRLAKEAGIITSAFNMVGIPGETVDTVKESVSLNRLVQPNYASCNIFMPFPGTSLYDLCEEKGYITDELQGSYRYESCLKLPTIKKTELEALAATFEFGVKAPDWLFRLKPMIDGLIKIIFTIAGKNRYLYVPISFFIRHSLRVTWKLTRRLSN